MITTSGGGALICRNPEEANEIMWYATQARDAYPYYQHTAIGYNYRMSNVCAGIGRGQMIVLDSHIAHHRHVQRLYEELLADVPGVHIHKQPADARFDANFWLCAATLDPDVHIKGQEDAYKEVIKTAVGGAAGVIHAVDSATTDCQPNANVEALRVFMLNKKIEARPTWKPMHKQPVYAGAPVYTTGVEEDLFKVGFCLPAGPYVSDEDVRYIVECIKEAMGGVSKRRYRLLLRTQDEVWLKKYREVRDFIKPIAAIFLATLPKNEGNTVIGLRITRNSSIPVR